MNQRHYENLETRELWRQNSQAFYLENEELAHLTGAELMSRTDLSDERRAQGREEQANRRLVMRSSFD